MNDLSLFGRVRSLLEETVPFAWLSHEERADLLSDISIEFFETGDVLLEQNEMVHRGLFIVESGLVRLMDVEQQRLIDKCVRGDTFGALGLIRGGARFYEARALDSTACAILNKERFDALLEAREDVAAFFEREINQYVRQLDTKLDVTGAYLLFTQPLDQYAHRVPVTCRADTTARDAAGLMEQHRTDTLIVIRGQRVVGLLTDMDLRSRLVARGEAPDTPIHRVMSPPTPTIETRATLFEVMLQLMRPGVQRVVVVENAAQVQQPVAVLSSRDVMHFRGMDPVATVRRVDSVGAVEELSGMEDVLSEQLLRLYQQQVSPEQLGRISAAVHDRMTARVLELVEAELRRTHPQQRPDLEWAWLRLGSGGRQEMALSSAQHNAILYADPGSEAEAEQAERWFALLAERANAALETCGFSVSETVASTPAFRKSLSDWKALFRRRIRRAERNFPPETLLCFDLRGVYGRLDLVEALQHEVREALAVESSAPAFLSTLADDAIARGQPRSLFRRLLTERFGSRRHHFNVRERGILPVVAAARVLALELGYLDASNTFDRLRHIGEAQPGLSEITRAALDAYQYLFDFRLEHQLNAFQTGEPPSDEFDPVALTQLQQDLLHQALGAVSNLQAALEKRYSREPRQEG